MRSLWMTATGVLMLAAAWFSYSFASNEPVTVLVDGQKTIIETKETSVYGVLDQMGLSLRPEDEIEPAASADLPEDRLIVIERAKEVTLLVGYGESRSIRTHARTVAELLETQGVRLDETDDVYPGKEAVVTNGMTVRYRPAFAVELIIGGKARKVFTYQTTVRDLLKSEDVSLKATDDVAPRLDDVVEEGETIAINTTRTASLVEEELLPFETETVEDPTLEKGRQVVEKPGRPGIRARTFRLTLENGQSKERALLSDEVTRKPAKQVIKVGTKPPEQAETKTETEAVEPKSETAKVADSFVEEAAEVPLVSKPEASDALDFKNAKTLTVEATAYTNNPESNGSRLYDGRALTATGYDVTDTITYQGMTIIAVDPKVIPLGSRVYVEGFGLAVALDTGGAIKGNKIDILVDGEARALQFGRKPIKVWVIPSAKDKEAVD